jgi:type II restriction enzyme
LRRNARQHAPKNTQSKHDDKKVAEAMGRVVAYLEQRFRLAELGYRLDYIREIRLAELMEIIQGYDKRTEFATLTTDVASMKPDGGLLILRKDSDPAFKRIALAVEMKRQGTNDQRVREGMKKQARGNAIERLGKNLIGIRATLQYEKVTPFVCFGWGVDFAEGSSIRDRIVTMNEFYPLNRIFVHKREAYAPVSLFFREKAWEVDELFEIMKEVAEASIMTYIY